MCHLCGLMLDTIDRISHRVACAANIVGVEQDADKRTQAVMDILAESGDPLVMPSFRDRIRRSIGQTVHVSLDGRV